MRISDWSSDVCSSDLPARDLGAAGLGEAPQLGEVGDRHDPGHDRDVDAERARVVDEAEVGVGVVEVLGDRAVGAGVDLALEVAQVGMRVVGLRMALGIAADLDVEARSEEHTSELQSLMRISYAVFCLKKKKTTHN